MRPSPALAGVLWLLACAPVAAQHQGHRMPQVPPPPTTTDAAAIDTTDDKSTHAAHEHDGQHVDETTPTLHVEPLPEPTAADRAAAFPDLHGMDMRGHMDDDPFVAMLQIDELEWRDDGNGDGNRDRGGLGWDVRAWAGYSFNRGWLRSEGRRDDGRTEHAKLELLWGHAVDPWWDLVVGVRHDVGGDAPRDWLAIGAQGLAPYKFEIEATAYLGTSGRLAATLEAEYDVLLTNRLILQPKAGFTVHAQDDVDNRVGSGISEAEFGLRLRYEWHRQFAPYLGYAWTWRFGRTADFARSDGEPALQNGWVAGVRFWF